MNRKTNLPSEQVDFLSNCYVESRFRRGDRPKYSYPQNGIPKVPSAPGCGPVGFHSSPAK